MTTEQKIQIGERVLLPNGKEAVVKQAWNPHVTWGPQYSQDEWEYHVSFPEKGLGGRLNYKENELKVWRQVPGKNYAAPVPACDL